MGVFLKKFGFLTMGVCFVVGLSACTEKKVRLGGEEGLYDPRGWRWVDVPSSVYDDLAQTLHSPSDQWGVSNLYHKRFKCGTDVSYRSVKFGDMEGCFNCYAVVENSWYRVDGDHGNRILSKLFQSALRKLATNSLAVDKGCRVCDSYMSLKKGGGMLLSKGFVELELFDYPDSYTHGKDKDLTHLAEFAIDPSVARASGKYVLSFRELNSDGGVDEWSVLYELQKGSVQILSTEVKELVPSGTFSNVRDG